MTELKAKIALPYWLTTKYPAKGGQDHLGIEAVVNRQILPKLLPGLNFNTIHPRYWSFYCFVLDEYERRDLPKTNEALVALYRPLEFIYSTACLLCEGEELKKVYGANTVKKVLKLNKKTIDPKENYYSNRLGGYGQDYKASLRTLGLTEPYLEYDLLADELTEEGKAVAQGFRETIQETNYVKEKWNEDHSKDIPKSVIEEYGNVACLCRLNQPNAKDRDLIAERFLHGGDAKQAQTRRESFRFILTTLKKAEGCPIDIDVLREVLYFRQAQFTDRHELVSKKEFKYDSKIELTARTFRFYQAREYLDLALEGLLAWLMDWGLANGCDEHPASLGTILESLDEIDFSVLADELGTQHPNLHAGSPFQDLLDWLKKEAKIDGMVDGIWDITANVTEHKVGRKLQLQEDEILTDDVLEDEDEIDEKKVEGNYFKNLENSDYRNLMLAGSLTLLALLVERFNNFEAINKDRITKYPLEAGENHEIDFGWVTGILRKLALRGETIGEVLGYLIQELIIERHQRVAWEKVRSTGDTFLFREESEGILFFRKDVYPGMSNPRFSALKLIFSELNWTNKPFDEHTVAMTEEGLQILESEKY